MHRATALSRTSLASVLVLVASFAVARGQSEPPPGPWRERQPLPGWVVVRTPSYEVQAEMAEPRARRLAEYLQGLRPHFEALWPARPRTERMVVKVFASREHRDAWLEARELWFDEPPPGTPPSCALHEPSSRDIVAFDTGRLLDDTSGAPAVSLQSDRSISLPHAEMQRVYPLLAAVTAAYTPDLGRDVGHEAWHQYLDAATLGRPPLPAWLDEGLADWLAAATPGGRPWTLRTPAPEDTTEPLRPGALHEDRLRDVLRAQRDGQTLPLRDLLVRITRLTSAEPPGLLAQGWSVVHFLQTSADATHRRLVPAFLDGLRASEDGASPAEDVLKDLDLRALDRAWAGWLASQQPVDPLAELSRELGTRIAADDLRASPWIRECYAWHRRNPEKPPRGGVR